MLVYVQAIEVFAEKVGTIKIVAKTADHCAVDDHGVEKIRHVRVWQTIAYAEQLHHCAQYVSAFSFSLQCVSFFYWSHRVFSWENLEDKERGEKEKGKERKSKRVREGTRERKLMIMGRDKVLVWGCMSAHNHCELLLPTAGRPLNRLESPG